MKSDLSTDIKRLRQSTGLSQSKFGAMFGVPTANIARWEQGLSSPPAYVLTMMRQILGEESPAQRPGSNLSAMLEEFHAVWGNRPLPYRELNAPTPPDKVTGKTRNCSLIAKVFQHSVFYAEELKLWQENPMKKWTTLQYFLYANRYKYLGKLPDELSDAELLRGFTISGLHKGFTVFDNTLMCQVLDAYSDEISGVYDPCAGWGERMLTCAAYDVPYLGVDINFALVDGYARMIDHYGLENVEFICADSSCDTIELESSFNTVITCPPYGDLEIYSKHGAENLSQSQFLDWWEREVLVAKNMGISLFCFQINRKHRDDMAEIVQKSGYSLIDEFLFTHNKSGCFTRTKSENKKTETESMLVFRREDK